MLYQVFFPILLQLKVLKFLLSREFEYLQFTVFFGFFLIFWNKKARA